MTKGATSSGSPLSEVVVPLVIPRAARKLRASSGTLVVIRVEALGEMELAVTP